MEHTRAKWGSNFGFLMAAIGSAVGLGNIWGFPYKMGANGGFAFLLLYLLLAAFVGFAVMLGELALGRKSGRGPVGTYALLSKRFKWVGWMGVLSGFFIMAFYTVLGGYCIKYMVLNIGDMFGAGFGSGAFADAGALFGAFITNPLEGVIYTVIFLAITMVIVMGGIKGGIENFSKIAMPALFVMLVITIIRSVTLPGAVEGLIFMFKPNFKPIQENFMQVLAVAGGQMFFSLSLGMGCMMTYGSYLSKKENLEKNSILIIVADTIVAILAGVAVLPAAFALGGEGAAMAGPSLLFVTLQNVFGAMGAIGPFFGFLFYLLVLIAAVTSAISLVEVATTFFLDRAELKGKKNASRKKYTLLVSIVMLALATIVAVDGLGSNGLPTPLGLIWIDFFDLWSEGVMMPLGAMLMALFIGYEYRVKKVENGVTMDGMLLEGEVTESGYRFRSRGFFDVCCKVIVPIAMAFILLVQIDGFFGLGIF
ncbi:MAG: sodium-dependent transporter [Clostridiales bacterium]|jgi:NSS family neurotransmitter:Na+ symporter|nr:sodium-dependent transporter [Clostridiales bacterium]